MKIITTCSLAAFTAASLFAVSSHAVIIFQDDFSGSSATDLNGTTPDVGGVNWVAHTGYKADGTTTSQSSATLAFTPVDDTIYQLDATYTNPNDGNWIGVGFANGQGTNSGTNYRFTANAVQGRGWALFRANEGARTTFDGVTTNNGEAWVNLTGDLGTTIDIRLVLFDAIAGAGVDWQMDYYAKLPGQATYTQIRATAGNNADDITSVGFANNGTAGTLEYFELSIVPEPSSLALLGLGGLLIARRRRG